MNDTGVITGTGAGGRGVLEGAFALLEVLAHDGAMGLTQLAAAAGLPKATAHRLLDQLVGEGAVQRRDGRYQLGPRVFRLGQTWQPAQLLRAAAAQPLQQLTASTEYGGFCLAVADRGHHMLIGGIGREIDAAFPLRAGVVLPPGTAAGQVLSPVTKASTTEMTVPEGFSYPEWQRLTTATRDRGLAYDTDLSRFGLACVAAPVRAPSGEVVAALAASMFEPQRISGIAESVRRAADLITINLARLARTHRVML